MQISRIECCLRTSVEFAGTATAKDARLRPLNRSMLSSVETKLDPVWPGMLFDLAVLELQLVIELF